MSIRKNVANEVHGKLLAAEASIDVALSAAAELGSYLPQARKSAQLALAAGHDALEEVGMAVQSLVSARKRLINAHEKLSDLAGDLALPAEMFGGAYGKPTKGRILELLSNRNAA